MRNARALVLLGLLLLMLACASSPSTPAADERLQSMVAEGVALALTQTALASPPTSTATAPPTALPPSTSTPVMPPAGSLLIKQADGSTLFMDDRAGFTVLLPEGWLTVRIGEQEFVEALALAESTDPLLKEALTGIRSEDPFVLRLFVVDLKDKAAQDEPAATIKFVWNEKGMLSFSEAETQALADDLTKTTPGLEVTSMNIFTTQTNNQFSVIEAKITGGSERFIFQKRVFFKTKVGTVSATLTIGKSLKTDLIPVFDAIMDTVKLSG